MSQNVITKEEMLRKVIAAYNPLDYTQIDLSLPLKNHYIAAAHKMNFCSHLRRIWRRTDSTALFNGMFTTLKTGNDVLSVLKS